MREWQIIESGTLPAEAIMAKDARLLDDLDPEGPCLLHFYEWDGPSATYGYFIRPEQILNLENLKKNGLQIARRPTGGGVIFHLTDLSFSVFLPALYPRLSLNPLDNYSLINRQAALAIIEFTSQSIHPQLLEQKSECIQRSCHFCMAKPTQYDLMIEGKKVGGAAQRRTKRGLLHQSSLNLLSPSLPLIHDVIKNGEILEAMRENSAQILPKDAIPSQLFKAKLDLQEILKDKFIKFIT